MEEYYLEIKYQDLDFSFEHNKEIIICPNLREQHLSAKK